MKICAILTCFNRRETTLSCLRALQTSAERINGELAAVLMDDGSTDATSPAVKAEFSWVKVIENREEPLFWCRGMHAAFAQAISDKYDYYLFINDDTIILEDALERLVVCHQNLVKKLSQPALVVGSTFDSVSRNLTYGGQRITRRSRTNFSKIVPTDVPQKVDTFNGNIVLLPSDVVAQVGNLDPIFEHAMGDTDYGLRARNKGIGVWTAPGYHGTCSCNPTSGTFNDLTLSLNRRWKLIMSRKGLPIRSWMHFTRRHTGWLWPIYFAWPYAKVVISSIIRRQLN